MSNLMFALLLWTKLIIFELSSKCQHMFEKKYSQIYNKHTLQTDSYIWFCYKKTEELPRWEPAQNVVCP